jgi:hypothetical protein
LPTQNLPQVRGAAATMIKTNGYDRAENIARFTGAEVNRKNGIALAMTIQRRRCR